MKIKGSFITNSSSTSFYFIFSGGKIDLYEKMVKYSDKFNLQHEIYLPGGDLSPVTINVWDVIREMEQVIMASPDDLWIKPKIVNVKEAMESIQETIANWENYEDDDPWGHEIADRARMHIAILDKCNKNGLCSVLKIGFGDNHGEICGGNVGNTMDYAGRSIQMNEDDLVIVTEQNR